MSKDDYRKLLRRLLSIARELHENSDRGEDWSKAFQIEDMAKEFAKDWEVDEDGKAVANEQN